MIAALRGLLAGLVMSGAGASASAANLSGHYLVTLTGHPSSQNGVQYCATLVSDGRSEHYRVGGTMTLEDQEGRSFAGTWFATHGAAMFEVPLPVYSGHSSFIVFSGQFGQKQISNTVFTEVLNGSPSFEGSFTAVRNGCT